MNYVKITNGTVAQYPYSVGQLRRDNRNVSFPRNVSVDVMSRYGMKPVTTEAAPDYNPLTQKVTTATTPTQSGNDWVLTRTVVDLSAEEIAANDVEAATNNRNKRNELLADTDYFALTDVTMDAAMTSHRQALRDITSHANWPNLSDSDWPTKP